MQFFNCLPALKNSLKRLSDIHAGRLVLDKVFKADVDQAKGTPEHSVLYRNAVNIAKEVKQSKVAGLSDAKFTGHSLGGGLAQVAHIVTGNKTFAYDPADLSRNAIGWARSEALAGTKYSKIATAGLNVKATNEVIHQSRSAKSGLVSIVSEHDWLDTNANRGGAGESGVKPLSALGYNDMGDKYMVKTDPDLKPYGGWKTAGGINAHSIDNMLGGIANTYQRPLYEGQAVPKWGEAKNDVVWDGGTPSSEASGDRLSNAEEKITTPLSTANPTVESTANASPAELAKSYDEIRWHINNNLHSRLNGTTHSSFEHFKEDITLARSSRPEEVESVLQEAVSRNTKIWAHQTRDLIKDLAAGATGHSKNILESYSSALTDPTNLESLEAAVNRDFIEGSQTPEATQHALWLMGESTFGTETASEMAQAVGVPLGKSITEFIGQFANAPDLKSAGSYQAWLG